jgi:hypothetical protein
MYHIKQFPRHRPCYGNITYKFNDILPYSCHSILDFIVGVINVQLSKLWVISFHWQQTTDPMIVFAIQNKRRRSVPTIHRAVNLATHWCEGKDTVKRSNIFHKVLASSIVRVIQISERFRQRWVILILPSLQHIENSCTIGLQSLRVLSPYHMCDPQSLHIQSGCPKSSKITLSTESENNASIINCIYCNNVSDESKHIYI